MELKTVFCFNSVFPLITVFFGGLFADAFMSRYEDRCRVTVKSTGASCGGRKGVPIGCRPLGPREGIRQKTVLFQTVHPLLRLNLIPCLVRV